MADPGFLAELHAQFGAPRPMVIALIEHATGQRLAEVERLTVGEENEIYRARLVSGATVYARIRPPNEGDFDQELWAMDKARAAEVPVPEVLGVEDLDTNQGHRPAMVLAAAPGRPLADLLPDLSGDQRQALLTRFGRIIGRLHTVPTPGPARPGPDGNWQDPDDVLRTFVAKHLDQRNLWAAAGLSPDEVKAITDLIGTSLDIPAHRDPVLCHGDLHQAHVYVTEELQIAAILDWGLWHGGTAIGELAYLSTKYEPDDFSAIVRGHGAGQLSDPIFRRRIALAVVNRIIGPLAWSTSIGNQVGSTRYVAALRSAMAELNECGP